MSEDREVLEQEGWGDFLDPDDTSDEFEDWEASFDPDEPSDEETYQSADSSNEEVYESDDTSDEFEDWEASFDPDEPSSEEAYQPADPSSEEAYQPADPSNEEAYQSADPSNEEAYQPADPSNEEVYEAADTSREEAYQSDESSDEFEDWGDSFDPDDPSDEETYQSDNPSDEFEGWGDSFDPDDPSDEETYQSEFPDNEEAYQSESPSNEGTYEVEIAYESAGTSNEEVCQSEAPSNGETYQPAAPGNEEAHQPAAPSNEGYSHTPENHSSSNSEDDPAKYLDKLEKIGIILSDFISLDSKIYDELRMAFTDMFKKHGADVNNRLISKAIDVFSQVVFCGVGIDTKPFAVDRGKYPKNNKILCKDLEVLVSGIYLSHSGTRGPDHYSNALRYSMLIHLEDGLRINEYLQTRRYLQDIDLLYSLIVNPGVAEEWNERVLQDIIDDSPNLPASRGQCENKVNAMIECLGLMYSSTFDLHPYPGVFLFGGMDKKDLSGKTYVSCQDVIFDPGRGEEVFRPVFDNVVTADMYQSLANAIQGYPEFRENHIEYERAYNLDEIISGHKYYPFACFSYATGSVLETENYYPSQEDIVYRRSKATSWSEYVSGVSGEVGLRERLTKLLSRYIYKALEHYGKNGFKFTDEDFKRIYNQEGAAKAYAIYTQGIAPQIASAVNNFVRSVCTACVLSRNDDDIVFKVKICTFEKHITKSSTKHLFDSVYFTQNSQEVSFPDANVIEVKSVNCTIYEFSFCRQQELMDKKPLFGYEAARLFQYQHRRISYDNILIGEDENGSPLFSNQGGIINIQGHVAHRISAGSRSGKGVMTMNILASSAASGAAIFYIDRKPDIGSELAYITDGNMFLVNGGDLQSGEDTRKCFIENNGSYGFMLQGYKAKGKGSFKYPYLTEVFGSGFGDAWAGAFGDFIYMKAVIFCLSLIAARMYFISNPPSAECRDALGIDRNVIVVIDEITNWHHWFESKYFPSDPYDQERTMAGVLHKFYSSTLGKASAGDDESSVIRDKLKKDAKAMLPEYEARYEQAKANLEAAEGADRDKAMKAVNSAKSALDKALKEAGVGEKDLDKKLYWSTFFDKYASSLDIVASIKNAGIKPEHTSMNDVFMIGQFISGVSNMRTNEPIAYTSDGKIAKQGTLEAEEYPLRNPGVATEDLDRSYMLGFAELVGCDWFTGRNLTNKDDVYSPRYPNFGGSRLGEKNPDLDNWLHTRGNWIYIPDGSQKDFRQGMPDISKVVKFKPYLVLNANDEPSGGDEIYTESYRKEHKVSTSVYKYVYGAADRVGIRSWKEIRKKHLKRNHKPPAYGQLEDGIGLRGLIKEYMYTDPAKAGCSFDKNCLSDSKVMADRICQRFGYEGYMDYLLDLSPRGIIGAQDIIDAYEVEGYAENENVRLPRMFPRYFNTGNQGLLSSSSDTPVASDESKKSFDFEVKGEEKPVSSPRKEEAPQPLAQTAHPNNPVHNIDLSFTWDTEFRLKIATSLADYALKVVNRTGDAELRQLCIDRAYKGLLDRGINLMANLPSEQDKKAICADLIDLINQYDIDRDKVIAQVEEDKLVSRPDEMPLTRTKEPETSEEAYRNAKADIQVLRGRRQIHPIDSSHIIQVFGSQPDGGRTAYTESFEQEVRKAATDKKLNWAEQEFTREPGVLRLKGRDVSYKLVRERVSWYEELSDKPEDKLANLELLRRYITKGIWNQFGGFERVTDIIISGGQLIINKFMYVPVIPPEYTLRLPLDTADYITSGCIAGLFNYNFLRQMKRLYSFYCDDLEFYTLNIADDLGLGRRIGVSSLFEVCPNLMELTIGDETLMRKDLYRDESKQMKEKVRRRNLFHRLTDSYKFNICAGTDSFQSYAFSNLKNYATNRGDKGIFRFCLGTTARTTIAAGATVLNLFAQVGREFMVMLKEST